ncbi:hypothetical protein [Silvanigrella sp.]|jgi:hypothetical protein|uniref:hypothetical protein n=1 Tax=Silvanigrella sp. TaxID=2024976 RepID=UPI0037CADBFB
MKDKKNLIENQKKHHDILAALRFLENLKTEIYIATNIEEINDPVILNKFNEVIQFLKKELL